MKSFQELIKLADKLAQEVSLEIKLRDQYFKNGQDFETLRKLKMQSSNVKEILNEYTEARKA
jgi:hypothetical protein